MLGDFIGILGNHLFFILMLRSIRICGLEVFGIIGKLHRCLLRPISFSFVLLTILYNYLLSMMNKIVLIFDLNRLTESVGGLFY